MRAEDKIRKILEPLRAEDRVLLLCLRPTLDPLRSILLEEAIGAGCDWPRLLGKGTYHRLLGLVHYHLKALGALDRLPPEVCEKLEDQTRHDGQVRAAQERTLDNCLDCLEAEGIEVALLKGPLLQELYPDAVTRATHDLDLLVHETDLSRLRATLEAEGYQLATRVPAGLEPREAVDYAQYFEQLRFVRDGYTEVEIHFRLYNHGVPEEREESWERIRVYRVNGRPVPGLSPEDTLLYLATHTNLHAFGRLLWFYDVAQFYGRWRTELDWSLLAEQAHRRGLQLSFYHALLWIEQLLFPEQELPELAVLRPSRLRTCLFEQFWQRRQVFALDTYIHPFDASTYYLLSGASLFDKVTYLRRILFPPLHWLAAHLDRPPKFGLRVSYLLKRHRERRDWDRITRRNELLLP